MKNYTKILLWFAEQYRLGRISVNVLNCVIVNVLNMVQSETIIKDLYNHYRNV